MGFSIDVFDDMERNMSFTNLLRFHVLLRKAVAALLSMTTMIILRDLFSGC